MKRFNDVILLICKFGIILLLPVMTLIVFAQVVLRYVFFAPLPWVEEFARYLLIWISTLGSAYAIRYGLHISVVFLSKKLKGHTKSAFMLIIHVLVLCFFSICVAEGLILSSRQSNQFSPALRVPMSWPLLSIPVGFGMMTVFTLEILIEDVRRIICGKIATGAVEDFEEFDL